MLLHSELSAEIRDQKPHCSIHGVEPSQKGVSVCVSVLHLPSGFPAGLSSDVSHGLNQCRPTVCLVLALEKPVPVPPLVLTSGAGLRRLQMELMEGAGPSLTA